MLKKLLVKIKKNNFLFLLEIIKNLIIALLTCFFIKTLLLSIGENTCSLNLIAILCLFFFSSLFLPFLKRKLIFSYLAYSFPLLILGIFFVNSFIVILVLVSIFFSFSFAYTNKFQIFNNKLIKNIFIFLTFYILTSFVFILFLFKINFSIDEGFLLLCFLIYSIFIFFIYISLLASQYIWNTENQIPATSDKPLIKYVMFLFLTSFISLGSFCLGYWNSLDLFSKPLELQNLSENNIFQKINLWSSNNYSFPPRKEFSTKDLVLYLEKMDDEIIDKSGCIYLLTKDPKWENSFKEALLDEAKNNKFLNAGGSVKAWQLRVSSRIYFYIKSKKINPNLFNKEENETIINWLKNINEYAYKITLADYSYAFLFKQKPTGFYYNQEIGFGMLALFYDLFKDIDPELAKNNLETIDELAIGWKNNFRNTDDGISYHQDVWIKNAYLLYEYAEIGSLDNAKLSFDWILFQNPYQGGRHPNYNSHTLDPAIGSMIIASHLTGSGEYKYMAENMIIDSMEKNIYPDNLIGFDLWDNNVESIQPEIQSYYIKGTAGTNAKPKELKPDKLVLRKIINEKELFILINLRSSGWHRYNGSGSIIMAKYGNKVLLEDNIKEIAHNWLPKGKAQHRDKKITNSELNIWQPESRGIEKFFYYLFSFDKTLKYKDYNKFIDSFVINKDKVIIDLDKKNKLYIYLSDNNLKIFYNKEENKILDYNFKNNSL